MNKIEDSKKSKRSLGNSGENSESKETLVFCTPGLTAVWVNENTREELTYGISRKEYFETSGPLLRIRFFGGWDFPSGMTDDPDFVNKAYNIGVPMGGELTTKPNDAKILTFAVWALKDPDRVCLDRIQIIKSWSTNNINQEIVYDVAWSGSRKPDPITGILPPIDNKIEGKNTNYRYNFGDGRLSAVWSDPDFDSSQSAVYYARVLEIASPPRVEYKAKQPGTDIPEEIPNTVQESAWTSPISYSPI